MMVGVAQIVLNTADLDTMRRPYLALGWKETFYAARLANHPAKRPFQAVARSALDMSHLTLRTKTSIEVTRYAGDPPTGTTVYDLDGAAVRVRACEPRASHMFWSALGFTSQGEDVLEVRAMLPAWQLQVALLPVRGEPPRTSVDAEGCVLVTLLTTAIERELEQLKTTGLLLRSTSIWKEQVGTRVVTVAFVEGPSGELVELLQVSGVQNE